MRTTMLILTLGLLVSGCQTTQSVEKFSGFDNAGFMSLWDTYQRCESGTDLDAMQVAADRLNKQAYQSSTVKTSDFHLPQAIERWVSDPPARLSVDPKAMAAACSLHTGQVALTIGRHDVANEMFQTVLNYPAAASPYYIQQARAGLAQLSSATQVSFESSLQVPRLVALSSQPAGK